jgi:SAM-dependent methyltransferase
VSAGELFAGTAEYYARYRPDFPREVYEAIERAFGLDGSGWLLDLGTGTGRVALALAGRFEGVEAVDASSEMVAEGERQATSAGAANVRFRVGTAEELDYADGTFRLVTMANAIHWMDGRAVLERLHELVAPGGGVALIGMPGMWSPDLRLGEERWLGALADVVRRHLGERRRAGGGFYEAARLSHAELIAGSPFELGEVGATTLELTWSLDEVVGYLYSTSFANRALLGSGTEAFEAELRGALEGVEPSGRYARRIEVDWAFGHRG